jgi:hypothetical protein
VALMYTSTMEYCYFHVWVLFHFTDFHLKMSLQRQWSLCMECCALPYIYPYMTVTFTSTCDMFFQVYMRHSHIATIWGEGGFNSYLQYVIGWTLASFTSHSTITWEIQLSILIIFTVISSTYFQAYACPWQVFITIICKWEEDRWVCGSHYMVQAVTPRPLALKFSANADHQTLLASPSALQTFNSNYAYFVFCWRHRG